MPETDATSVLAAALAEQDGYDGHEAPASYRREAEEVIGRLAAAGWRLTEAVLS